MVVSGLRSYVFIKLIEGKFLSYKLYLHPFLLQNMLGRQGNSKNSHIPLVESVIGGAVIWGRKKGNIYVTHNLLYWQKPAAFITLLQKVTIYRHPEVREILYSYKVMVTKNLELCSEVNAFMVEQSQD